jgi:hypothetical protein
MDGEPFRTGPHARECRWCHGTCEPDDICCADMAHYLGWKFPNADDPADWPPEFLAAWQRGQAEHDDAKWFL